MSFYENLGSLLRRGRESEGMTQQQLADAVGLSRTSITNIEAGRQALHVHTLVRLAQHLRLAVADLLAGERADPRFERELERRDLPEAQKEWARRIIENAKQD